MPRCKVKREKQNKLTSTNHNAGWQPQTDCKWSHCIFSPVRFGLSLSLFLMNFAAHAWVKNCQAKKRLCVSRAVLMICDVSVDWMPTAANLVPLPIRNRLESAAVKLYSKGQLGTQARWTSSEIKWIKLGACACRESEKLKLKNNSATSKCVKKIKASQETHFRLSLSTEHLWMIARSSQGTATPACASARDLRSDMIWSWWCISARTSSGWCCLWRVPGTVQSTHANWKTFYLLFCVFYFAATMLLLLLTPVAWPKCVWNLDFEWPSKRHFSCESKSFEDGKHVGISLGSQVSTFSVLWSFYKVCLWSGSAKLSWLD